MNTTIQRGISLQTYNTFGIDVQAKQFVSIQSVEQLQAILSDNDTPIFVLGGGSNLLLTKDVNKLVLKNEIKGINIVKEDTESCTIACGGGESWHQLVLWAVEHDLGGIENLSLIPGTVGASPIQNIGAYGVELQDVFVQLEAVHLETGTIHFFDKTDCQFGYRMSVFKRKFKGLFFITKVYLKLSKKGYHQIHSTYGAIQTTLQAANITHPTIKDISDAVIAIRSAKLPDPAVLGNSGSFFKNPVIDKAQFLALQKQFPSIVFYALEKEQYKIPAGWLIEQCGWKGKAVENVACYQNQALVLVNLGGASGAEIYAHAERIIRSVENKFGIKLSPEVNIL